MHRAVTTGLDKAFTLGFMGAPARNPWHSWRQSVASSTACWASASYNPGQ